MRAPAKSLVERNSFVMRTSEGFRRVTKESDVLAPGVPCRPANGWIFLLPGKGCGQRGERFSIQQSTELQMTKRRRPARDGRESELAISFIDYFISCATCGGRVFLHR